MPYVDVAVLVHHLGQHVRKKLRQLGGVLGGDVRRAQVDLLHGLLPFQGGKFGPDGAKLFNAALRLTG